MVAFNFNVYGHDLERGLMILRDSLTAATAAFDQQRERISAEYDAYNAALELNALGDECQCSCMGEHHGSQGPAGRWKVVSNSFATRWGESAVACRLIRMR